MDLGTFYPPYGVILPVASALLMCVCSYYAFKYLNSDTKVPIDDTTKTHSWKQIKLTSKVLLFILLFKINVAIKNSLRSKLRYIHNREIQEKSIFGIETFCVVISFA